MATIIVESLKASRCVELKQSKVIGDLDTSTAAFDRFMAVNVTFADDVHIVSKPNSSVIMSHCTFSRSTDFSQGSFDHLSCSHCIFTDDAFFDSLSADSINLEDSYFAGDASFVNIRVTRLNIDRDQFEKSVDLSGAILGQVVEQRIRTNRPIEITWEQFGDKWLQGFMTRVLAIPPSNPERKSMLLQLDTALRFWKKNFHELGSERDALEADYQLTVLRRHYFSTPSQLEWWALSLVGLPSRYGTRPYRPVWLGLLLVVAYGLVYWKGNAFVRDDQAAGMPNTPLFLFAIFYSFETFLPVVDITGVRNWGWKAASRFRWVELSERIVGLLMTTLVAYSITVAAIG